MATETLRPNAAGDEESLSGTSGAGNHWQDVNDVIPDEDATTVWPGPVSGYLRDLYNLPASSGAGTINFIKIYVRCRYVSAQGYAKPSLKSNATVTDGNEITLTGSYVTYSQQWNTNPADAGAWEWADIDALQIGVSLRQPSGRANTLCTQVYVEVDYTEVVGTNMKVNIADVFKDIDAIKINISDVWKDVAGIKINIGDVWKDVF